MLCFERVLYGCFHALHSQQEQITLFIRSPSRVPSEYECETDGESDGTLPGKKLWGLPLSIDAMHTVDPNALRTLFARFEDGSRQNTEPEFIYSKHNKSRLNRRLIHRSEKDTTQGCVCCVELPLHLRPGTCTYTLPIRAGVRDGCDNSSSSAISSACMENTSP